MPGNKSPQRLEAPWYARAHQPKLVPRAACCGVTQQKPCKLLAFSYPSATSPRRGAARGKKLPTLPGKPFHEALRTMTAVKGADPPPFTQICNYWAVIARLWRGIACCWVKAIPRIWFNPSQAWDSGLGQQLRTWDGKKVSCLVPLVIFYCICLRRKAVGRENLKKASSEVFWGVRERAAHHHHWTN